MEVLRQNNSVEHCMSSQKLKQFSLSIFQVLSFVFKSAESGEFMEIAKNEKN